MDTERRRDYSEKEVNIMTITIEPKAALPSEEMEKLEDRLRSFLTGMGIEATISDDQTGNTTVSSIMSAEEARVIADEALRIVVTNEKAGDLKDFLAWELDLTDEALKDAVDALFREAENITLDAKKYATWILGTSAKLIDARPRYKTLWDIPHTYLPGYVFASGFDKAKQCLPSDGSCVQISCPAAKELKITWINLPGGS